VKSLWRFGLVLAGLCVLTLDPQAQTGNLPAGSQGQGLAIGRGSSAIRCTVSASPLAFGRYRVFDVQALDSTADVTVSCTRSKVVEISISPGLAGNYMRRMMTGPSPNDRLFYQVYSDRSRNLPVGDGSNGTHLISNIADPVAHLTVYGRVTPLQKVRAGSYSDQLLVTIRF
jgi:spore coat protein U-like protein